jgi:hypothetical protein
MVWILRRRICHNPAACRGAGSPIVSANGGRITLHPMSAIGGRIRIQIGKVRIKVYCLVVRGLPISDSFTAVVKAERASGSRC